MVGSDLPAPVWLFAGIATGWIAGMACHEAGHFLCAVAGPMSVRRLSLGTGPLLLRRRVRETWLELRLFLWHGCVVNYPVLILRKYWSVLFVIGGVLGNLVLLGLLLWLDAALPVAGVEKLSLAGAALAQLAIIIAALLPYNVKVDDAEGGSDGRRLLTLLRARSGPTGIGLAFAAILRAYSGGREPALTGSAAASRICYHLSRADRWTNAAVRRDVGDAFLRELGRGGLAREEEVVMLDALMTDTLVFGAPALRARLDEWSLRALQLAPDVTTLRGTRGGVLAELDRYDEAKTLLEPFIAADGSAVDRVLGRAFLARAECRLGNMPAARQLVEEAREICAAGLLPRAFTMLVGRVNSEISSFPPSRELLGARAQTRE